MEQKAQLALKVPELRYDQGDGWPDMGGVAGSSGGRREADRGHQHIAPH